MVETKKTLLVRLRDARDGEAWEEFFKVYAPLLEGYARSYALAPKDAEDVRDLCLAVIAIKMPDFEYEEARGGFKGWLFRIAQGKIIDHVRRNRMRRAETGELGAIPDRSPAPDEAWEVSWRATHLRYCLERAREHESERTFQAFELLLLEDVPVIEVCERLDMNANQVYKAKARVLKRVREIYERLGTGAVLPTFG